MGIDMERFSGWRGYQVSIWLCSVDSGGMFLGRRKGWVNDRKTESKAMAWIERYRECPSPSARAVLGGSFGHQGK